MSNIEGADNSFFGKSAGTRNTTGTDNSFFGQASGAILEAPGGRVDLDPEASRPRRIELTGGVSVSIRSGPEGALVHAEVPRLLLSADAADGWQILATTDGPWIRMAMQSGATFFERVLETGTLRGAVGPEGLRNIRAEQGVCIREVPLTGPVRTGEAEAARLWFEEGGATDVELDGRRGVARRCNG